MQLEEDANFCWEYAVCRLKVHRSLFLPQEVRGVGKSVLIISKGKCVILILIKVEVL